MYKIFIDAGHGGSDPGACDHGLQEKELTLKIAKACRTELAKYQNVDIRMTRSTDKFVHLNEVCSRINAWDADLAVSIHINAGGGTGREALIAHGSTAAKKLSEAILNKIGDIVPIDRGIKTRLNSDGKTDYFAFNRIPKCPSPIIECFFIDSMDYKYAKKTTVIGKAIAHGIADYLNLKKKPTTVKYEVAVDKLNVRMKPSAMSKKYSVLKKGAVVSIVSIDANGWGKTVNGHYVRIKSSSKVYCKKC